MEEVAQVGSKSEGCGHFVIAPPRVGDCTHEASGIKARQIPTYKLGSVRALGVSVQKC